MIKVIYFRRLWGGTCLQTVDYAQVKTLPLQFCRQVHPSSQEYPDDKRIYKHMVSILSTRWASTYRHLHFTRRSRLSCQSSSPWQASSRFKQGIGFSIPSTKFPSPTPRMTTPSQILVHPSSRWRLRGENISLPSHSHPSTNLIACRSIMVCIYTYPQPYVHLTPTLVAIDPSSDWCA